MIVCVGKGKIATLIECYGKSRMHLRNDVSCFLLAPCLPGADGNQDVPVSC